MKQFVIRPMGGRAGLRVLAVLAAVVCGAVSAATPPAQRPFQVDDLFELQDMGRYYGGPYAFSADGQKLAFTLVRPKRQLANHKWEYLWGNAGSDVWVQLGAGQAPVNITNGAKDGSGWWAPQWSPDGRKLALLSTRGGNVRAWIWDLKSRHFKALSVRGVDLVNTHHRPYLWVDNDRLLYPALPEGEQPSGMKVELQTPQIAAREWPKVIKGEEPTASELESGVPVDLNKRPQSDLLLVDVESGAEKIVERGETRSWRLSPNGEAVVFTRQIGMNLPQADKPLSSATRFAIELVRLDGTPLDLRGELSRDVLAESVRWSPDSDEVAFLGFADTRDQPPLLYRLNLSSRAVRTRELTGLNAAAVVRESAQLEWTGDGNLIVRAEKYSDTAKPDVKSRRDWWLIQKTGTPKNLTAGMKTPPRELWAVEGRRAFAGIADGDLWRIEPSGSKVVNLTEKFEPKIDRLSWPSATNSGSDQYHAPGSVYSHVIFSVREDRNFNPYRVDMRSGAIQALAKPHPEATLVAYEPQMAAAIFHLSDRNGMQVWRSEAKTGDLAVLVQTNQFLRDVAEAEFKKIEYISLNGAPLKGWVLLPPGYEAGKRYPLLTWVYAGAEYGDRPPLSSNGLNSDLSLNMQIPAARGYVVLFPSMPLKPEGEADDPMLRLPEGVLPAVDKVIEMGIADPKRLFLMGQSFGGFSTYGLVTQTKRFKAAVSLAGLSNLISLYGQFDARDRYTQYPQENRFQQWLMEEAQVRMGSPPWKDLGRYIRNSPVFFVDRVETPLMIVYGDVDYVAIQQGEEFFMSLYRQGKRAKFVRYWGEGHVFESPANIRDLWKRIFQWLETFVEQGDAGAGAH